MGINRLATYILFLVFALSGSAKLAGLPFEVQAFERWGYAPWFMYLTGLLEVAGAIGLLVRPLASLAATCLALLMTGAIATHIWHQEWVMLGVALGICLLSARQGWSDRAGISRLLRRRSAGRP